MTKLELAGTVDTSCDEMWYGPRIGGVNVIERIDELWPHRGTVKVYLGIEPQPPEESATGKLGAGFGFSGTEVTPGDAPIIMVGGFDLMNELEELDDREVLLIIEDEQ